MDTRVLVTGGAGFIGSHICDRLLADGCEVVSFDNLDDYYSPGIKRGNIGGDRDGYTHVNADITDFDSLMAAMKEHEPDYVIHEAAQAGVRASVEDPAKTNRVNIMGTVNVLEAIRASDVKKLVFASSSSIYGKVEYLPFDEEHPKNPISPYGITKLACEMDMRVWNELYGIDYVALRYFTVFGPRIRPDLAIHKFIRRALEGGTFHIYGDGSKSRDFTYVDDAVAATIAAMTAGAGPYNIGGGTRITVAELAKTIIDRVGSGKMEYEADQAGDVIHTASDCKKARAELGWGPATDFGEGLESTIEWMKGIL